VQTIERIDLPLRADRDGVVRVGTTRVTLETVVGAFDDGLGPEEIVQQYPTLEVSEVYAVISYYLQRRPAVQAYTARREAVASDNRATAHSDPRVAALRARLLAHRQR